MDARRQTALHQQQRVRRLAASTDVDTFASLLSRPDLLDCIEALLPRHRERLFPPAETLSMFMAQALYRKGDRLIFALDAPNSRTEK